jgi:hypothetical protein
LGQGRPGPPVRSEAEEQRRKMKLDSLQEQLFASAVGMDPALDGFSGVLVEIYRERDPSGGFRYVLLETACVSGNQLLRFSSKDKGLVYAALARELDASLW